MDVRALSKNTGENYTIPTSLGSWMTKTLPMQRAWRRVWILCSLTPCNISAGGGLTTTQIAISLHLLIWKVWKSSAEGALSRCSWACLQGIASGCSFQGVVKRTLRNRRLLISQEFFQMERVRGPVGCVRSRFYSSTIHVCCGCIQPVTFRAHPGKKKVAVEAMHFWCLGSIQECVLV